MASQRAPSSFGDLLRQHRLAAGLTQEALAERAGLSVHGVQKLERGGSQPYRDTTRRLLQALQLALDDHSAFWAAAQPAPRQHAERSQATASRQPPARHDLPVPVTSFIGRRHELSEIQERLGATRPLTLTGVGGCGKTRLALEVARSVQERYADGVWMAELAPLADPSLVPQTIAAALDVRAPTAQAIVSTLITALRTRHLLLVLDNCEHLLEASARMVHALLNACSEVQVLATSREALNIAGEVTWRVPSLPVPDLEHPPRLPELQQNPCVQLLVERAVAVQPRFALTERNAPAMVQVCQRLDGIPLALELAAAEFEARTVEQIAGRLDRCFRLLTGGSRVALPRQQTLRATLDWSYDLLSEPEQRLFSRLSVFGAGLWKRQKWSVRATESSRRTCWTFWSGWSGSPWWLPKKPLMVLRGTVY